MKYKALFLIGFLFSMNSVQAQKTFLRPLHQSSLAAIHPGMMIGNYTSHLGFNFQHGKYSGNSLTATYGAHTPKLLGSFVFSGVYDNNRPDVTSKSLSASYVYRIILTKETALQIPVTYTWSNKTYDSIYFGGRYGRNGRPNISIEHTGIEVKSHGIGTGLLYYKKPQYVYSDIDTNAFFPTYDHFLGFYANHIIGSSRGINLPEESNFHPPLTWVVLGGYRCKKGKATIHTLATYQFQGASTFLSGHPMVRDVHVFDLSINTVVNDLLVGLGGRQITGLEHTAYMQSGVRFKRIEILYSLGFDLLNSNVRHQFTTSFGWKRRKPPRYFGPLITPDF